MNEMISAANIRAAKKLAAVHKHPGRYVGDINDGAGLHRMVFELVNNAIDEALAGHCSEISVRIHADESVSVVDNGRGIPVDIHPEEGISAAEVILTVIDCFDVHSVGISVVSALSGKLQLTIFRDGKIHQQDYSLGVPQTPLAVMGNTDRRGTDVHFWPSPTLFPHISFQYDMLANYLCEKASQCPGLRMVLVDDRCGKHDVFEYRVRCGLSRGDR